VHPTDLFETEARRRGYRTIAGLDEAGRGPLAGPVVAAVVVLPRKCKLDGLNDSKQLPEPERERLYHEILNRACALGIGLATAAEIDTINILQATRLAMSRALEALTVSPDFLLLDAVNLPSIRLPQRPIIKGDGLSISIAAASILAKVSRDRLMRDYHKRFPHYNFQAHKGYATPEHLELLAEWGPCELHRRTFQPVLDVHAEDVENDWELFE
jgi:ribonuclease HII